MAEPPAERLAVRQQQSVPVLDGLKARFEETLAQVSAQEQPRGGDPLHAIPLATMTRFATDGRLEICNNAAERAMRPIALGRHNWTFAGSDAGGERAAADVYADRNRQAQRPRSRGVPAPVIARIADYPARRIDELLPWNIG